MRNRFVAPILGLSLMAMPFGEPPRRERDTKVYSPRLMHKDTPSVPFTLIDNKKVRKGAGKRMSRAERKRFYKKG